MKKSTLIVSIALATVGLAYAGDDRIELSQLDFGSPPYVISEPGSYVFTENVTVTNTGVDGISVIATNVTIDLNGFTLMGPGAAGDDGITQPSDGENLTVRNGIVTRWGNSATEHGIETLGRNNRIERIHASLNGTGIETGRAGLVLACSAYTNGIFGIDTARGGLVNDCTAYNNGSHGITVACGGHCNHDASLGEFCVLRIFDRSKTFRACVTFVGILMDSATRVLQHVAASVRMPTPTRSYLLAGAENPFGWCSADEKM